MTSNEMLSTYEALSELTSTMLAAARQGEWDEVASLEARCRDHIGNLQQSGPIALDEREQRAKIAIVRAILQNDARIRALAEPRLHELQQRLSHTRQGQRGMKAYHAHRL
ncbi:MAG: flagellar protein FliT [Hydrogenophilales bacterium 16-64-46]|nr:MAG: flagellar protein FliT [Hydrogenophilales bacterium 12-64-13]OYZ04133.1 MAG: flagellar protein FliT [Hydrogenophilales bacterium 16-64-46]OZA36935.1 MAG: flagellar protein FliT [Hydrogenophilales bacterium 17-64-34]